MENAGTWNSDLAILFFFCLMAPIAFYFLGALFQGTSSEPTQNRPKRKIQSAPRQTPTSVNISVSVPNLFKGLNPTEKPSKRSSKRSSKRPKRTTRSKKKNPAPASPKPLTDETIVLDAVGGLCSLGYKRGEATKIVKSISDKKKYDSSKSLVKDCFWSL